MSDQLKWDLRFLEEARRIALFSKDPSTKVGAVITDADNRIVSVGYNGFAKGVNDDPERYANRELKYKMVVHGEINAILFAKRCLKGCTLYTVPFMPCSRCTGPVIQSGIIRCVAPVLPDHLKERWEEDIAISKMMFEEAGIKMDFL